VSNKTQILDVLWFEGHQHVHIPQQLEQLYKMALWSLGYLR